MNLLRMQIKNKKLSTLLNVLGVLLFVAIMVCFVVYGIEYRKERKENGCYTIGVTEGFRYIHKQGRGVKFVYSYQGKEYRDFSGAIDGTKYKGGKYLVKLSTKNPKNVELDVTIPIQGDSIPIEYRPLCSEIEKLE